VGGKLQVWRDGFRLFVRKVGYPVSLALTLVLGAALLGVAALAREENENLAERGVETTATVVDVSSQLAKTPWVSLRFQLDDGQLVIAERVTNFYFDPFPRPGDTASIIYDPERPAAVIVDTRLGIDHGDVWFPLVLGGGFLAMASISGFRRRRERGYN